MKRLILILMLPLLGLGQEYVTGCRGDLNLDVEQATLPFSIYTNGLKFWMDNVDEINKGATNWFLPDLSTNRNDATQTVTGYQPTLITTNGVKALKFDGVNDRINLPYYLVGESTIDVTFRIKTGISVVNSTLFGAGGYTAGAAGFLLRISSGKLQASSASGALFLLPSFSTNSTYEIHFQWDGTSASAVATINGTEYTSEANLTTWSGNSFTPVIVGAYGSSSAGYFGFFNGEMYSIVWAK